MPDQEWLRNLAAARLVDDQWQAANPGAVKESVRQRIATTTGELQALAEDYADALSEITQRRLNIRVLPLEDDGAGSRQGGFLLMLERCQMTIALHGNVVQVILSTIRGFTRQSEPLHRFVAHADALGEVLWRMDNTLLMSSELIIKRLFEDLARAARSESQGKGRAMRIQFNESNRDNVLTNIKDSLGQRKLADLLEFTMEPGSLTVTINKLGTTVLSFAEKTLATGLEYTLTSEKVALTHRAFKAEVTAKIVQIVEKAGGKVFQ